MASCAEMYSSLPPNTFNEATFSRSVGDTESTQPNGEPRRQDLEGSTTNAPLSAIKARLTLIFDHFYMQVLVLITGQKKHWRTSV